MESVSGPGACRSQWGAVATDRSLIPRVDSGVELRSITPGEYRGDWIDRNSLGIWVPTRFNVTFSSHGGGVSGVEGRLLRSMALNGSEADEAKLKALEATREDEARLIAGAEASTRKAELVIEARHLAGDPDLLIDDALAFLAKRGNTQAKALLAANTDEKQAKGVSPSRTA